MKHFQFKAGSYVGLFAVLLFFAQYSAAQGDSVKPIKKWNILLEPYMMFPNMQGVVGLGNLPDATVDENPGDIFENFIMGAMLYGEVYNLACAFTSDFTYMKLGSDIAGKNGIISGNGEVKQLAWELAALRRFKPWLEA